MGCPRPYRTQQRSRQSGLKNVEAGLVVVIRVNGLDLTTYIQLSNLDHLRRRLVPTGPRRTHYECHQERLNSLPEHPPEPSSAWGVAIIEAVLRQSSLPVTFEGPVAVSS